MKSFFATVAIIFFFVLTSCQKEASFQEQRTTGDSTAQVFLMFKIVESDPNSPDDSITRIIKRIETNGVKTVIMNEIYSDYPSDTALKVFSYDAQNHLTSIKAGTASNPAFQPVKYYFSWNGSRLTRVVCDTLDVFAGSYDFSYTTSGSNTIVSSIKTPSNNAVIPDYILKTEHNITVNSQFIPISEQWINHLYGSFGQANPNLPQMAHDTANIFFTYSGSDLSSYDCYTVGYDTNTRISPYTNFYRDTLNYVYSRGTGTSNIFDSLKAIYGQEVYTLMNFELLDFYYYTNLVSSRENEKYFFARPLSTLYNSRQVWVNGVFDSNESYTNELVSKMDNTFDARGRLTQSKIYMSFSSTQIDYIIKVYYQ